MIWCSTGKCVVGAHLRNAEHFTVDEGICQVLNPKRRGNLFCFHSIATYGLTMLERSCRIIL